MIRFMSSASIMTWAMNEGSKGIHERLQVAREITAVRRAQDLIRDSGLVVQEHSSGNVTRAAEMCDLTRAAFQRIMRSLDLDRSQFTSG